VTTVSPAFSISVDPGELHFNAAHFITFDNCCENLHGHNFHVRIDAHGNNDTNNLVIDFVLISRLAADICSKLNNKVLLPDESDVVRIEQHDNRVYISSHDKQFILPKDNCYLLPVSNTTAEMLAWYIGECLVNVLKQKDAISNMSELNVAVEEADHQWGLCRSVLKDGN